MTSNQSDSLKHVTADVLNCVKLLCHVLNFLMHIWRQDNSNSQTQEHEGYVLSTKTHRSHITRDYMHDLLGQGQ